jgi:beta-lactamase class A
MAGTLKKVVLGDVLSTASRRVFAGWLESNKTGGDRLRSGLPKAWTIGDKTGNNGKDAAGDIAAAWTSSHAPIIIAAYTRGGAPTEAQFKEAFHGIGLMVAAGLGGGGSADAPDSA